MRTFNQATHRTTRRDARLVKRNATYRQLRAAAVMRRVAHHHQAPGAHPDLPAPHSRRWVPAVATAAAGFELLVGVPVYFERAMLQPVPVISPTCVWWDALPRAPRTVPLSANRRPPSGCGLVKMKPRHNQAPIEIQTTQNDPPVDHQHRETTHPSRAAMLLRANHQVGGGQSIAALSSPPVHQQRIRYRQLVVAAGEARSANRSKWTREQQDAAMATAAAAAAPAAPPQQQQQASQAAAVQQQMSSQITQLTQLDSAHGLVSCCNCRCQAGVAVAWCGVRREHQRRQSVPGVSPAA
jgi:hypothetical protein